MNNRHLIYIQVNYKNIYLYNKLQPILLHTIWNKMEVIFPKNNDKASRLK
jgi:hypothetical protein